QAHYNAFFIGDPPVIVKQPQGGTFLAGSAPTLTVKATGPSLAYQWYKGASALSGATNSALAFSNLTATNAGTYSLRVSNITTTVTSSNATIALASLPARLVAYQTAVSNEPSLISYYTFDRLLPEDVFGPNEGTLAGTAGWAPGIGGSPGQGLLLDGAGHVNLGAVPRFDFVSGSGAGEGWIRAAWIYPPRYHPLLW